MIIINCYKTRQISWRNRQNLAQTVGNHFDTIDTRASESMLREKPATASHTHTDTHTDKQTNTLLERRDTRQAPEHQSRKHSLKTNQIAISNESMGK